MRIIARDWKEVGLTATIIAKRLGVAQQVIVNLGRRGVGKKTITYLAQLLVTFPEKKELLVSLFEKKLGAQNTKMIVALQLPLPLQQNYEEKFYLLIGAYFEIYSGLDQHIPDNVIATARSLNISVDEVLEAVRRKVKE